MKNSNDHDGSPVRFVLACIISIAFACIPVILLSRDDFDGGAAVTLFIAGQMGAAFFYLLPQVGAITVAGYVLELDKIQGLRDQVEEINSRSNLLLETLTRSRLLLYRTILSDYVHLPASTLEELESKYDSVARVYRKLEEECLLGEMRVDITALLLLIKSETITLISSKVSTISRDENDIKVVKEKVERDIDNYKKFMGREPEIGEPAEKLGRMLACLLAIDTKLTVPEIAL